MKAASVLGFYFLLANSLFGQEMAELKKKWTPLLDEELSQWEVFVGVPHTSVKLGGYEKSEDVREGTPVGLKNVKNIYSTQKIDGELTLRITGEIYAGLTTLKSYENYHLKAEFKWGDKKWEPRLEALLDNGILYHCQYPHAAFWNVWMSSLEFQVQEGDIGDFISIEKVFADIPSDRKESNGKVTFSFNPKGKLRPFKWENGFESGLCSKVGKEEAPIGEWNTLELMVIGSSALHIVNGELVNIVRNARMEIDGKTVPVTKGKIQIQSEAAEAYYKNIVIRPIHEFPKEYNVDLAY